MPAESFSCKINGCEELTTVVMGAYAFRCAIHRKELAEEIRSKRRVGRRKAAPEPPKLKDSVELLYGIAERIDNSAATFRVSKNQLIIDIGEFTHRLDSLKMELKKLVINNAN